MPGMSREAAMHALGLFENESRLACQSDGTPLTLFLKNQSSWITLLHYSISVSTLTVMKINLPTQ